MEIRVSTDELAYLRKLEDLPARAIRVLADATEIRGRAHALQVDNEIADTLRDRLTLRLAQTGFDARYELNHEGKMAEDLIDRFWPAVVETTA